jgi:LysM repeat protein
VSSYRRVGRQTRGPLPSPVRLGAPVILGTVVIVAAAIVLSAGGGDTPQTANASDPKTRALRGYVVRSGDSVSSIAARHRMSVSQLLDLNRRVDPTDLRVGERLRVPR